MFKVEFFFEDNSQSEELERRKAALVARQLNSQDHKELTTLNSLPQKSNSTIIEKPLRKSRSRVAVANEDVEFSNPRKRTRKKAPAKVRYLNTSSKIKNVSFTPYKIGWLICLGLFMRLVFMDNGVIDFYKMESHMQDKLHGLELLKQDNVDLITEVHRIKTEPAYQKKLAREHLGVIAADEYLILFAQESSRNSI